VLACSRWQRIVAQSEVHVQLITRQLPAVLVLRDERRNARIHQRELQVWIGRPVAESTPPVVADEAFGRIELSVIADLSFADLGPAHNHLQHARILWRSSDLVEARL